ncbi:flagellar hook-associated protein FlgK [Clostridium autoethanogenum]|uniref:Flagellar hook-associated protein 1 n=1 Tax=Clostridium autoethanogenum DSM 10061 TaxID=1341692 RepID=A0ABN4BHL4_9CLOT|nr:flagellar hook-associated protein FlgK [Clostridium autoethanogenum]AGY77249.1 flagellar hook-associated protein FlgK [Clostridium autoethanogenum DSM 10061]ALU37391.1 Flagellar hook-associated protein FlgK [Clostridium autoethanogenum DSM 10061]OVY50041.1 Flagellar hook-associated protein 1 [Clostridium autoethanogenum]
MPGLFSIFNTAKSGLFAQQTAINVTSHNIANANTDGYSRQRADMETTTPYTLPSVDGAAGAGQLGTGVTVDSIERIRDSFLDYQIRVEKGANGQYKARDKYLSQVEKVLGTDVESSGTGISSLIQKFFSSWQSLSTSSQNVSTVKEQAYQLTNELNHTYSQVSNIKTNTNTEIKNVVVNVNNILGKISNLNQQIKDTKATGQNPNDLLDSRDLLLDQLSSEFGINITDKDSDGIDVTTSNSASVEGDNGSAPLLDGKPLNIVQSDNPDDTNVASFSYITNITAVADSNGNVTKDSNGNTVYKVDYYKKGDTLTDANKVSIYVGMTSDQEKELDENRVLWADADGVAYKVTGGQDSSGKAASVVDGEKLDGASANPISFSELAIFRPPTGELKGYTSVQKNIDDYQDELNNFAKGLALSVNAIISQSSTWVADNVTDGSAEGGINNFFVNADQKDSSKYSAVDENNITAANITVNVAIMNDPSKIKVDTKYDSKGNSLSTSTDGNRAVAVAQLANSLMNIGGITSDSSRSDLLKNIFKSDSTINNVYSVGKVDGGSTLDNYFNDLVNKVGNHEQEAKQTLDTQSVQLQSYTQSREANSGVSIDEEMTNLIQFQHCYQANAKMISTVDELLDVVINQLKK